MTREVECTRMGAGQSESVGRLNIWILGRTRSASDVRNGQSSFGYCEGKYVVMGGSTRMGKKRGLARKRGSQDKSGRDPKGGRKTSVQ